VPSRSGARPGDRLWLTGALGAAMAGLEALQRGNHDPAASLAYRRPTALLAQGQALAPRVTAMMDVSDGLLLDALRMARASGVTIAIAGAEVPITVPEARRDAALRWGDDYQLLFALPADEIPPVPANMIGEVIPSGPAPLLLDAVPLTEADELGYRHA
jgi:thiamine-monophosphate kinase